MTAAFGCATCYRRKYHPTSFGLLTITIERAMKTQGTLLLLAGLLLVGKVAGPVTPNCTIGRLPHVWKTIPS